MADVLIVDSSDICRELLGGILEVQGYTTARAAPEEALKAVRQTHPAMLVLEPGEAGSVGWEFLAKLHATGKAGACLPVVIVSEQSDKRHVLRAAQLGVRDYMLKKRFSLAELLTRVRRHVAPGAGPAAHPIGKIGPSGPSTVGPTAGVATSVATDRHGSLMQGGRTRSTEGATVKPGPLAPAVGPKSAASFTEERKVVVDAARDLGLMLLTRERTLEQLESAPVKTLPGVVAELISLVNSPRGTVSDVASVLRRDPVLTARILRVANSASFTTQKARVATVEDAVKNIGVGGVRKLVINVGVFDAFATNESGGLRVTRVWQHCLGVAMIMEKMAIDDPAVPPGSAYLVGLCHDLADIVLRQHFSAAYGSVSSLIDGCGCSSRLAQAVVFGLPYAELVSQLLSRLHLPPLITLPIEEFFERGDKKGGAGAGSLLGRTLRAINVYAHGLLLAPGLDEPITPLTRAECANTFGNATMSPTEDDTLRSEALATASVLAGLTEAQTQQMFEPLVPARPIRLGYSRHGEYAGFDPLAAFLRLTTKKVEILPPLSSSKSESVTDIDGLIVAGPRSGAGEIVAQDLEGCRRLVKNRPVPVLYAAGFGDAPAPEQTDGISIRQLPLDMNALGEFLAQATSAPRAGALARAA